ncbi:CpaD family pilus assembly lipoprotein [Trinickia sp.]|uniref:CpaD family pilus assembly lipoprotein n=1 Tax=Trinickia sp. TaxID=2571163 RepID=UPI003F7ED8E6
MRFVNRSPSTRPAPSKRTLLRASALLSVLLAGCLSTAPPIGMPDATVIGVEDGHVVPPDCDALATPTNFRDAGAKRPTNAFGCATYRNLAAVLVRPADLVAPRPFAGADAPVAASAVHRYETGKITPLPTTETSSFNK